MTDYRFVLGLLAQGYAYRQIEAMAGCSHRAIARARRVLAEEGFTTRAQVDGLSLEDTDRLFTDGRKSVVEEFVPVDIDKVVAARLGRSKPPLKVLWARYLETDAPAGARFYGYERFCQIVAEHVRVNDLTLPIARGGAYDAGRLGGHADAAHRPDHEGDDASVGVRRVVAVFRDGVRVRVSG